jgi:hypothetical protein
VGVRREQEQDFILQELENTKPVASATYVVDIHNEFIAQEKELFFYSGKAVLNKRHGFFGRFRTPWNFSAATGFTFKIWEEREDGYLMIDWTSPTNLTLSATNTNEIILNAPASDTAIERGNYYYEIEYIISGGYSILIGYGRAVFI